MAVRVVERKSLRPVTEPGHVHAQPDEAGNLCGAARAHEHQSAAGNVEGRESGAHLRDQPAGGTDVATSALAEPPRVEQDAKESGRDDAAEWGDEGRERAGPDREMEAQVGRRRSAVPERVHV